MITAIVLAYLGTITILVVCWALQSATERQSRDEWYCLMHQRLDKLGAAPLTLEDAAWLRRWCDDSDTKRLGLN